MLKRSLATAAALSGTLAISAAPAFAHVSAEHGSFAAGLAHPFTGTDHMLAMVAIGIWAAQLGGRARFALPAAFIGMMVAGFGLALAGVALPQVEPAILASVVGLGLLVAAAVRLPTALAATIAGLFALFHGHAHGAEMVGGSMAGFGAGFVLATALLHAAGLIAGSALATRLPVAARLAGGMTAAAGLVLVAA